MLKDNEETFKQGKVYSFVPTGEYYFYKGINAYDQFDLIKAKKYLKRALELEPFEPMIACQLALIHTEAGEYEESNKLLNSVINDLDQRMTECYYFLANNYAHLGLFAEAYKYAQLYLEMDQVLEFIEEVHELLDVIGVEDIEELSIVESQEVKIEQQEEARKLLEKGNYAEAIQLFKKLIADSPEYWPAYNNLALAYYYEGDQENAQEMLQYVLEKNPGNLHALCNLAVFYYFEKQDQQLTQLLDALEKVRPILLEHRYKLAATFALTGRYKKAYFHLRKIQLNGFFGDPGFYYWLAKAAHFTGNDRVANDAWKQLASFNANEESIEPWNDHNPSDVLHQKDKNERILNFLQSNRVEDQLYGVFLLSLIQSEAAHLSIQWGEYSQKLSNLITNVNKKNISSQDLIEKGNEIAFLLFQKNHSEQLEKERLIKKWFSLFLSGLKTGEVFQNSSAFAAATEYIWLQETNNKQTQKKICEQYGISITTLRKYIDRLKQYWN